MASPIIRKNRIVQKEWVSAKIAHTENQQFYDLRPYDLRVYDLIDYVMYLFFDTETTWLPENYKAPLSDSDNRPRAVQLAWLVYDENFKLLKEQNHIIKPEWFTIPRDAVNIHGISNARAKKEGHQLQSVLEEFLQDLNKAHTIIAHNISFDISIIWAELYRKNLPNTFQEKQKICTMLQSTQYVGIPSGRRESPYKRPNLMELYVKIFNKPFHNAHNALEDIKACAKCFLHLKQKWIIKWAEPPKSHKSPNLHKSSLTFDSIAQKALDMMIKTNKNIFLTWKAGTWKSTLLMHFLQQTKKKTVVLAPTGVAALNVGGMTIHSFFGFHTTMTYQEAQKKGKQRARQKNKKDIFLKIDTIVIDEISMVRADMLDCVDIFLQEARKSSDPFGGVQMIFIGDLYQLPPVVTKNEKEFFTNIYPSPFFFSSHVFTNPFRQMEFIELEKIYRQTDQTFVDILNAIRNKSLDDWHLKLLNMNVHQWGEIDIQEGNMYLVGTNAKADQINMFQLAKLPGKIHKFRAHIEGNFQEKQFPTDELLQLKVGSQVMFVANDTFGWQRVNGTVGKIIGFEDEGVVVEIFNGETVVAGEHTREVKQYIYDTWSSNLSSEKVWSFTQLPLMLAWAITIHKSQGKTFDKVIIDLTGTFAHGQAYVALSRCRSLSWLSLVKPMIKNHVIMDRRIIEFLTRYQYKLAEKSLTNKDKLALISEAIADGALLEITYLKTQDVKSKRIIQPKTVWDMLYNGVKFLGVQCFCHYRQEERVFRVDRILEMKKVSHVE